MEILDTNHPISSGTGGDDPDTMGTNQGKLPEGSPRPPGAGDREGEAPKRENNLPRPSRPGRSSFGAYRGNAPKVKVGYPCLNCPHAHIDHSYYSKFCLIDDCPCPGLKLDVKSIATEV